MRKLGLFFLAVAVLIAISGCSVRYSNSNSINQSFTYRNTEDVSSIRVGGDVKTVKVSLDSKVKSGSVRITVEDPDGKVLMEGSGEKVRSKQDISAVPGEWKVRIQTKDARNGSIHINFDFDRS